MYNSSWRDLQWTSCFHYILTLYFLTTILIYLAIFFDVFQAASSLPALQLNVSMHGSSSSIHVVCLKGLPTHKCTRVCYNENTCFYVISCSSYIFSYVPRLIVSTAELIFFSNVTLQPLFAGRTCSSCVQFSFISVRAAAFYLFCYFQNSFFLECLLLLTQNGPWLKIMWMLNFHQFCVRDYSNLS